MKIGWEVERSCLGGTVWYVRFRGGYFVCWGGKVGRFSECGRNEVDSLVVMSYYAMSCPALDS